MTAHLNFAPWRTVARSSVPSSSAATTCSPWPTGGSTGTAGDGHVLLVAGEAGLGKTRLLGAIERRASGRGLPDRARRDLSRRSPGPGCGPHRPVARARSGSPIWRRWANASRERLGEGTAAEADPGRRPSAARPGRRRPARGASPSSRPARRPARARGPALGRRPDARDPRGVRSPDRPAADAGRRHVPQRRALPARPHARVARPAARRSAAPRKSACAGCRSRRRRR